MKKCLLVLVVASFVSCSKDEEKTVYEKINGKWIVESQVVLGLTFPGDGSYIAFRGCQNAPCDAKDYEATNGTSGAITYEIAADESTITFTDTTTNGGWYNGTFIITTFSEEHLNFESTVANLAEIRMKKEDI